MWVCAAKASQLPPSNLHERGVISYVRGTITLLDRPKLEATVCECYRVVKK